MIRPYYNLDDDKNRRDYYGSAGSGFQWGLGLSRGVKWITFTAVAMYLIQLVLGYQSPSLNNRLTDLLAFVPQAAFKGFVWQFVTYMFLHSGFFHLFLNMFFFLMVGGMVEGGLGTRRFLWLFFLSGVGGALTHGMVLLVTRSPMTVPMVGASGAIMGTAAACAMLYPDMRVLFFFIIPMRMRTFIWVLVAIEAFELMGNPHVGGGGVANLAHLGGLAAGYIYIVWHRSGATLGFMRFYYRLRGRWGRYAGGQKITHIDDDTKYQREVDRLLDKIFKEGTQSLSKDETDFLKKQSERYKR